MLDLIFWGRQLFIQESKPVTWALSHLIGWNFAILSRNEISPFQLLPYPGWCGKSMIVWFVGIILLCFCLVFLVYLFSVFPTEAYVPRLRLRLRPADGWKFIFAVKPANVIIDRHLLRWSDQSFVCLLTCDPCFFFLRLRKGKRTSRLRTHLTTAMMR